MSSSSRSDTLLCLFLLLGCIGIATATATEPKTESFGTSSIGLWPRWWWPTHPKIPSPPTPSPSPIDNVASPTHMAPSPVDDVVLPPHTTPASSTSCTKVDGCALDLITSVFKRRISLSTQCCQGLSTISDDCFYREYTHSKRVPFFLRKVRNYCSHAVDNASPSPSPSPVDSAASPTHASPSPSPVDNVASPTHVAPSSVDNVASPTHAAPSPSLVDNAGSPTHAVPSPSPVDDVVSPLHMAPSWGPSPAPTTSCIKVNGCTFNLITSVFKRKISLSTQCCQVLSAISDDCFYKEFTHSKRVPFFLRKVRNYCSHHQA
uniref:Cold acclimation protein WCOR518, related n=1 Tax=Solanum demissum TaxID=50514 RepID=Q6L3L4_SOLDE|nr:cold acclimation protein WCOR518, related [Solanum demissum]